MQFDYKLLYKLIGYEIMYFNMNKYTLYLEVIQCDSVSMFYTYSCDTFGIERTGYMEWR